MVHFLKEKYLTIVSKEIVVMLVFLLPFQVFTQVFYSTDPNYLKGKSEQNNLISTYKSTYPDTSLTEFNNYFPRNFMGNMGMPSPDHSMKYGTDNIGFRFFDPPTDNDRFDVNRVRYFRTKGPYASLTGIAGSKRYEIFKMLFSHTYRDKINITAGFQRYTSKGFYNQQQTYTNNFFLSSNYTTQNKRFGYYLYILNNGNKNQENGGIKDVRLTDSSLRLNKELFPVNLNDASRENREQKFMFNPWFKLNSRSDSMKGFDQYLQLKSNLINGNYTYKASGVNQDDFYQSNYFDTLNSNDSSHVRKYENDISYSILKKTGALGASVGYLNEIVRVWQLNDTSFMNHVAHTEWVYRKELKSNDTLAKTRPLFETQLAYSYVLEGANQGNYKLESKTCLDKNDQKKKVYHIDFLAESRNADHMQRHWRSNHFIWDNRYFKSVKQLQVKFGFDQRGLQSSVFFQTLNNYVYFDKEALPQQASKAITNFGVNLGFSRVFFKHLGFALNYLYQNTSQPTLIRIPESSSTLKLFFTGVAANNNLHIQIGAQLSLYDSFTSYAYMPSTQAFYLQDNFRTEMYPYLDLYLNVRIRPVSFFVKVENILYGFAGTNYAFVPGYYQTDRAFRFGINWMFFD
jgi:hypothetical protein